jgi:hypothetical protein
MTSCARAEGIYFVNWLLTEEARIKEGFGPITD